MQRRRESLARCKREPGAEQVRNGLRKRSGRLAGLAPLSEMRADVVDWEGLDKRWLAVIAAELRYLHESRWRSDWRCHCEARLARRSNLD
jgi:hypothetical protein